MLEPVTCALDERGLELSERRVGFLPSFAAELHLPACCVIFRFLPLVRRWDVGMELQFVVFVLLMRRKELGVGTRSETGRTFCQPAESPTGVCEVSSPQVPVLFLFGNSCHLSQYLPISALCFRVKRG